MKVSHTLQCNCYALYRGQHPRAAQGSAGTVADTKVSVMAKGPTTFITVLIGAIEISAGAILRPCISAQLLRFYGTLLCSFASEPHEQCLRY